MTALIERLERAEGADRELDLAIGLAIGGWTLTEDGPYGTVHVPGEGSYPNHPGSMYPALTESIDAAVALVERVLPGMSIHLMHKILDNVLSRGVMVPYRKMSDATTAWMARSLCIAILRSMESRDGE